MQKCKSCGNALADNAKSCPACGWVPPPKTSRSTKGIAILIALVAAIGIYSQMTGPSAPEDTQWKAHGAMAIAAVKVWRNNLKDPDSAKIRSATLMPSGAWCIDLGAKNGFGAYVRNHMLISPSGAPQFADANSPSDDFRTGWNSDCNGNGKSYTNLVQASM